MDTEEQKNKTQELLARFKDGETTAEEDLQIATAMNNSLELAKLFLNEIKVEQKRQQIMNTNQ